MIEQDQLVDDFLEHHGIKGMKWGIRNKEEKKARREAKAKKFVDKASALQKELDKKRQGRRYPFRNRQIRNLIEERNEALEDAERKRQGKLSRTQKRIAIGAGAAVGIAATVVTLQALNSGNARRLVMNGKDFITRKQGLGWKVKPELRDPNLDVDGIMTKIVPAINPGYGDFGTKMNCRRATFAYEMRRRGYDVMATKTHTGRGQDISGVYNALQPRENLVPVGISGVFTRLISERNKVDKPYTDMLAIPNVAIGEEIFEGLSGHTGADIVTAITRHPDGARGEFGMQWIGGGGHSMAWEKIKGEAVIFDNQTGISYRGDDIFELAEKLQTAGITRLDNLPLNQDFLRRWIKDA